MNAPIGHNRRPILTAAALAGLTRLGTLIPYSAAAESPDVRAALEYVSRLVAFENSPRRAAKLAAIAESVRKTRPLVSGATRGRKRTR